MNKIIINTIIFLSLAISSLSAEVYFDLRFRDPIGTGFNDPKHESKKKAVIEGADLLGKCIKQNAFVTVAVTSREKSGAASEMIKENKFFEAKATTKAMNKILKEINEEFSGVWEGRISFNLDGRYDIKSATIHELTHALGFGSLLGDPNKSSSNEYSDFDRLISDWKGRPLVIEDKGYIWDDFKLNPNCNLNEQIFACGPNIRKHNDGKCVALFSPQKYKPGTSFSHLDTSTYPINVMNTILYSPASKREKYTIWNKYEIGIMEDLGYNIDWENYCHLVENEFQPLTLNVNLEEIEGKDFYFVLKNVHEDFPKGCSGVETFYGSFTSKAFVDSELQLFVNEELVYKKDNWFLFIEPTLRIFDKDYSVEVEVDSETRTVNLSFIEKKTDELTCS